MGWERANCLLQRDRPESQPGLPVIPMKISTVEFSNRPRGGSAGIWRVWLNASYHLCALGGCRGTRDVALWACLRDLHIKFCTESPWRIICSNHVQAERVGATRRHHPICTSAACSLKISPSVRRSCFALQAHSPAAVHIKVINRGFCTPAFLYARRMLHSKEGNAFPYYYLLKTCRQTAQNSANHMHSMQTIKGHRRKDF